MTDYEYCCKCDEPTGKAGRSDDSLYTEDDKGPFCEECFPMTDPRDAEALAEQFVGMLQVDGDADVYVSTFAVDLLKDALSDAFAKGVEAMCMQNRSLLCALAKVTLAESNELLARAPTVAVAIRELDKAVCAAGPRVDTKRDSREEVSGRPNPDDAKHNCTTAAALGPPAEGEEE